MHIQVLYTQAGSATACDLFNFGFLRITFLIFTYFIFGLLVKYCRALA